MSKNQSGWKFRLSIALDCYSPERRLDRLDAPSRTWTQMVFEMLFFGIWDAVVGVWDAFLVLGVLYMVFGMVYFAFGIVDFVLNMVDLLDHISLMVKTTLSCWIQATRRTETYWTSFELEPPLEESCTS